MQIRVPEPLPVGLTVIETMRGEPDGGVRLWPLHLARLRRDCAAVGIALDEDRVSAVLALPRDGQTQRQGQRLRLIVDLTGHVELTRHPLPPAATGWRVALSPLRLDSRDPWLRIKTSHRPVYDAARAAMPGWADEVLLLNERGEVCEGSISNVFLCRDGQLLTPPLSAGLLPGVLRQHLIDTGQAREARLTPSDLASGRMMMGNALRGLIPAVLDGH